MTAASRALLYDRLRKGPMFAQWHWLQWNFQDHQPETHFARLTIDALLRCDAEMPGFADAQLSRLERIGGRDRDQRDYQQILQWLSELVVVHHFVVYQWPVPVTFQHEPTIPGVKSNPEITVTADSFILGVEVKAPDLSAFDRHAAPWQLTARVPGLLDAVGGPENATLPRDNPLKSFLQDADRKFAAFREAHGNFRSVLVVVWDDYVNEPISALLSEASGLLTPNSFDRTDDGSRRTYQNVDAVVLVP